MSRFINNPNIPLSKAALVMIDGRVRKSIIDELERMGVCVITTGGCLQLYEAVSYHPDMLFHHLGGNLIVAAPNAPQKTVQQLVDNGFNIIAGQKSITGKYPDDIAYNVARIGDYAVCNVKYSDKVLLEYLISQGVKIIDVRQGYAKCSMCVVDSDAVITSDEGIYKAMDKEGFDVLKICPGSIELEGFLYGFIGGASGLTSNSTICFAGNIKLHPEYEKIIDFLCKHGKKMKNLDSLTLVDVGTIIPLKEYCIEEIC